MWEFREIYHFWINMTFFFSMDVSFTGDYFLCSIEWKYRLVLLFTLMFCLKEDSLNVLMTCFLTVRRHHSLSESWSWNFIVDYGELVIVPSYSGSSSTPTVYVYFSGVAVCGCNNSFMVYILEKVIWCEKCKILYLRFVCFFPCSSVTLPYGAALVCGWFSSLFIPRCGRSSLWLQTCQER